MLKDQGHKQNVAKDIPLGAATRPVPPGMQENAPAAASKKSIPAGRPGAGQPEKEKELPPPVDAQVEVMVEPDGLSASVIVHAPQNGGAPFTLEMGVNALKKAGVSYGVNNRVLWGIVSSQAYGQKMVVAKGQPPVDGQDGTVELLFSTEQKSVPVENEDGSVDFYETGQIVNVAAGTVICNLTQPVAGTPGLSVYNKPLPAYNGKMPAIPQGNNTQINEEGTALVAVCEGKLVYKSKVFVVETTHQVQGDVDINSGNIDFWGNVVISGDVREGFKVVAKGDITISGIVENAYVAAGGNITLRSGMNGMGRGTIIAKGNLTCKFIENAVVRVGGKLTAEYMANSQVICDDTIELTGQRARLIGGEYTAVNKIIAKEIGTDSHAVTVLVLGVAGEVLQERADLETKLKDLDAILENLSKNILFLQDKKKQLGALPPAKELLLAEAVRAKTAKTLEKGRLVKDIFNITEKINTVKSQDIVCKGCAYPGVKIVMRQASLNLDREYPCSRFYYSEEEHGIVIDTYISH